MIATVLSTEEAAKEHLVMQLHEIFDEHAAEHSQNPKHGFFQGKALEMDQKLSTKRTKSLLG